MWFNSVSNVRGNNMDDTNSKKIDFVKLFVLYAIKGGFYSKEKRDSLSIQDLISDAIDAYNMIQEECIEKEDPTV